MRGRRLGLAAAAIAAALIVLPSGTTAARPALNPVVVLPAFHFTKLRVTVHDQRTDPACPRSGSFEDWFLNDHPSTAFSQVCRDELMTLRYESRGPWDERFSEQRGVKVEILDYGKTGSAPF